MKNINWARKLTSRKFWAAAVGFVTPMMVAAGATDGTITQVTAIIMGGATLIAYIIGEGMADSANAGFDTAVGIEVVEDDKEAE